VLRVLLAPQTSSVSQSGPQAELQGSKQGEGCQARLLGHVPQGVWEGMSSCPSWMPTCLLSHMHTSCPTRNASGKARCQHDGICRKALVLLSTRLFPAERHAGGEDDPESNVQLRVPQTPGLRCAGPCGAALQLQQEGCNKSRSVPFPKTAPHVSRCFGFFLLQD